MKLSDLSKDERNLLLYLETCVVDYGGLVDVRHMNDDDIDIVNRWNRHGFIFYGRVCMKDIKRMTKSVGRKARTNWVSFTDESWELAHAERRARYERLFKRRHWKTTEQYRAAV